MKSFFRAVFNFIQRTPAMIDIEKIDNGFLVNNKIYCRTKQEVKGVILESLDKILGEYKN